MTGPEQINAFANDLTKLVARYCAEFDLTTAAAIGVLAIKQHELIAQALDNQQEDEE